MAIKMIPDLGAPVVVFGIDQLAKRTIPDWAEWVVYAETVAGYLGAWMGWGGDFVKNIGVASLPMSLNQITERVAGGVGKKGSSRLAFRKTVARYPGSPQEAPFGGVKLV